MVLVHKWLQPNGKLRIIVVCELVIIELNLLVSTWGQLRANGCDIYYKGWRMKNLIGHMVPDSLTLELSSIIGS